MVLAVYNLQTHVLGTHIKGKRSGALQSRRLISHAMSTYTTGSNRPVLDAKYTPPLSGTYPSGIIWSPGFLAVVITLPLNGSQFIIPWCSDFDQMAGAMAKYDEQREVVIKSSRGARSLRRMPVVNGAPAIPKALSALVSRPTFVPVRLSAPLDVLECRDCPVRR